MPHIWVDPEIFLEHNGVTVYHCYKHDEWEYRLEYWFQTDTSGDYDFDVRTLERPDDFDDLNPGWMERLIRHAIDTNQLKLPPEDS